MSFLVFLQGLLALCSLKFCLYFKNGFTFLKLTDTFNPLISLNLMKFGEYLPLRLSYVLILIFSHRIEIFLL